MPSKTPAELAEEAMDIFGSQQAMSDDVSVTRVGELVQEAFRLGQASRFPALRPPAATTPRPARTQDEWARTRRLLAQNRAAEAIQAGEAALMGDMEQEGASTQDASTWAAWKFSFLQQLIALAKRELDTQVKWIVEQGRQRR